MEPAARNVALHKLPLECLELLNRALFDQCDLEVPCPTCGCSTRYGTISKQRFIICEHCGYTWIDE